ncbi:MAG: FIVAR domain-containing protein, partial [Defluviitaleaceae bacterium]|nr:FIVAR domain-containing protein [Defluviitaleaceae bacterium]
ALLPLDELPELSDEMSFVFFDLEMFGATDPGELATIRFRINDTRIPGEIPVTLIPVSGHVTSWNAASTERPVEVGTQGLITIEPIEDVPTDPNPATLRDILRELIQEATARTQTNYTPMSWARMQSMLTSARAVYNNQTSTDAQIEQAIHLLTGALVSLIER